jgi:hypothetical protein
MHTAQYDCGQTAALLYRCAVVPLSTSVLVLPQLTHQSFTLPGQQVSAGMHLLADAHHLDPAAQMSTQRLVLASHFCVNGQSSLNGGGQHMAASLRQVTFPLALHCFSVTLHLEGEPVRYAAMNPAESRILRAQSAVLASLRMGCLCRFSWWGWRTCATATRRVTERLASILTALHILTAALHFDSRTSHGMFIDQWQRAHTPRATPHSGWCNRRLKRLAAASACTAPL